MKISDVETLVETLESCSIVGTLDQIPSRNQNSG